MLRHPKGKEGRQDREQDLDQGLVYPPPQAQHCPADTDAPQDFADEDGGKHFCRLTYGEDSQANGSHGETIKDQRRGIVCQSFAFEHNKYTTWYLHSARDGEGGNGIGRRNDGAQYQAHRPRKTHEPMGRGSNRERCKHDAANGEKRNRAEIEPELAPVHLESRGVDNRRQHKQEHDLRCKLYWRQTRH